MKRWSFYPKVNPLSSVFSSAHLLIYVALSHKILSLEFCYVTEDGVKWVAKRPRVSITASYRLNGKPLRNHAYKYSDISMSKSMKSQFESRLNESMFLPYFR